MKKLTWLLFASLTACGGSPSGGPSAAPGVAGPSWAQEPDESDDEGNTFNCMGEGKSEQDALDAALGICNDKICKLCGVEIESVVQTTETLTGVEMQRQVVERCRRVRKAEADIRYKSSECGPTGCFTWVQIFYSKEDEKAECEAFGDEHYADPAECERLITEFRTLEGRQAKTFHERTELLDKAKTACAEIDVRPTPLIQSLDEKLRVGMENFEHPPTKFGTMGMSAYWGYYLKPHEPLHQEIRETAVLVDRIGLIRDLVHNKALLFDVIEATLSKERESEAGLERVLTTMKAAPPGKQYNAGNIHMQALVTLDNLRLQTPDINAFIREIYAPEKLDEHDATTIADFFESDDLVDEIEWSYIQKVQPSRTRQHCQRILLRSKNHGSAETRIQRFLSALEAALSEAKDDDRSRFRAFQSVSPREPELTLSVEAKLPEDIQKHFDWAYLTELLRRAEDRSSRDTRAKLVKRLTSVLQGHENIDDNWCNQLAKRVHQLRSKGNTPSVGEQVCSCLTGPFKDDGTRNSSSKSDLYDIALTEKLPCVQPK